MSATDTAASGLIAVQKSIEYTANNLANAGTGGYKKEYALLASTLYQNLRPAGAQTAAEGTQYPVGFDVGSGVQVVGTGRDYRQGSLVHTDNRFDVAIVGEGLLQIQNPDGTISYTRNGQLQLDKDGNLVNHLGYQVLNTSTIPNDATSINISDTGEVSGLQPGQTAPAVFGQIDIARFTNQRGLRPLGDNLYAETEASGPPTVGTPGDTGMGKLTQYSYEASNVEAIEESTNLVRYQHIYRMNTTVFDTEKKNNESLARVIGV